MASATTMAAFDDALKQYYTNQMIENLTYPKHPFLALIPKDEKFKGKNMPLPVIYGNPQGRSATFSTAQSNATATKVSEVLLSRVADYGVVTISNETVEASEGNEYAFISAEMTEINGIIRSLGDSLSYSLFRGKTGSIGKVNNSVFTGTAIDLVTDNDALNFEIGMKLVVSSADGGGSVRSGTLTVTAVNRTATSNQITTSVALSTGISAIAQNDFVFVQGDYDSKINGLLSWLPTTAPTSGDSFFSLDRSVDPTRLGGMRYDGSAQTHDEALIDAASLVAREGGSPDYCFTSYGDFAKLMKVLGSQVQRDVAKVGRFSFSGVELFADHGVIKVVPDKDCPLGRAFLVQMDTWKLYSLGRSPRIFQTDGLSMLRQATDDGIEVRAMYYAQAGCRAPGWNCNVTLST